MRGPSCGNANREGAKFCDSCGAPLQDPAEPEATEPAQPLPADVPERIAGGRYHLRRFLGEGARKLVYLADDTAAGREVAVARFDTAGA
ncbi:MAG: zinc-ribbon domain-containing protein, partial [Solirubrobacterales bacterium]